MIEEEPPLPQLGADGAGSLHVVSVRAVFTARLHGSGLGFTQDARPDLTHRGQTQRREKKNKPSITARHL